MATTPQRLWILRSKGGQSAFAGNMGYEDVLGSTYVYDSTVQNYSKLNVGDFIIIRDTKRILGFSKIDSITREEDVQKSRFRCPECGTTEIRQRRSVSPQFICRNKHPFDAPRETPTIVSQYSLQYSICFIGALERINTTIIAPYYINFNRYYSIQEANLRLLINEFPRVHSVLEKRQAIETVSERPYDPQDLDERDFESKKRPMRKGQPAFKGALIKRYGAKCMLTGCSIEVTIEAAHIRPYRGRNDNHPQNGLLFRRDIHSLFDNFLLGIDPKDLKVHIDNALRNTTYQELEGMSLQIKGKFYPSKIALERAWELFQKKQSAKA